MTRLTPRLWISALLICAVLALAGCVAGVTAPIATVTPDLTLAAIPRMLTLTATAPTITVTPLRSATPTRTPTATPTATPYPGHPQLPGKIGQAMQTGGVVFTILGVESPAAIPGLRAREGQRYVEFDVLVENATQQEQEYNRLLFRLAPIGDDSAPAYEPLAAAAGPLLLSGPLRSGEWVRGRMAFAVPQEAVVEAAGAGEEVLWLRRLPAGPGQAEVWVDPSQKAARPVEVPETGSPAFGDTDDLPGTNMRVSASGITLSIDNTTASPTYERVRAARGKYFFIMDVTITNDVRERAPFNAEYFRIKDANGYEYIPVVLPSDALVIAGSLGKGQKVSGQVIFELPEDVRAGVVKYRPQVLVDPYEEIRIRIGG